MNQSEILTAPKVSESHPNGVGYKPLTVGAFIFIIMGCSKLRMVWMDMKRRCNSPKRVAYKDYGGRGIKVCVAWYEYEIFKKWALNNGYSETLLLDRINNDGDYEPKNCQFVTRFESELNKRNDGFNGIRFRKNRYEVAVRRYGVYFHLGTFRDIYEAVGKRDEFELKINTLKKNILQKAR
jgi:hypothetical protein